MPTIRKIKVNGVTYDLPTGGGSGAVNSVNGKTGDVVLTASDVGAITNTVNNLTNYYLKTETYTKTEVDNLIGAISTISFEVVQTLPTTNIKTNVIYLVPKSTAQTNNTYDEYINTTGTSAGWEKIGDTEIDLSEYVKDNPTFTEASARVNIASGESFATILGKIKKWFSDLKDLAFIAKDGTSSTKYLRGDGTWQPFPTIPTVNNGKLTIQKNGTQVAEFTANQSGNTTANITVPTKISDLTNDSNFRSYLLKKYQKIPTSAKWYRMFSISYSSYNYLHLRFVVKHGYSSMTECFADIRYTPSGVVSGSSFLRIIPTSNAGPIVMYQIDTNTVGFAAYGEGVNSDIGFDILDITSEVNAITVNSIVVSDPFVALNSEPTTFGQKILLNGDYTNLINRPSLNFIYALQVGNDVVSSNSSHYVKLVAGTDITISADPTNNQITINSTSGGSGIAWGSITGTLSNQTDLQNALNGKVGSVNPSFSGNLTYEALYNDNKEARFNNGHVDVRIQRDAVRIENCELTIKNGSDHDGNIRCEGNIYCDGVIQSQSHIIDGDGNDLSSLPDKQDKLVSGTNIKTINNTSLLGSGNLSLEYTPDVLWTNSSPTSNFAGQTITLSKAISNYTYYEIIYKFSASVSNDRMKSTGRIPVNCGAWMDISHYYNYYRSVDIPSGTSMVFSNGVRYNTYGNSATNNQNGYAIPYKVLGWK